MIENVILSVSKHWKEWFQLFLWIAFAAPLVGSFVVMVLGKWIESWVRWLALVVALITFAGATGMLAEYRFLVERKHWTSGQLVTPVIVFEKSLLTAGRDREGLNFRFIVGADGISVALVWLVAVLVVSSVLVSLKTIRERQIEYYGLLLLIVAASIGVFIAFDIILFYVFFEFTLLPMFFLIGIWGGPERRYAARKFFIYTLAGSFIGLVAIIAFVVQLHSLTKDVRLPSTLPGQQGRDAAEVSGSLPHLADLSYQLTQASLRDGQLLARWRDLQKWAFWGLFLAFAIKVPIVPFHTWLPLAHVEAPTVGSVFLAGVLLKLGTYGFLRICLPLLPHATFDIGMPTIAILAIAGIIYGSLCAAAQWDIKRLVAYSSIAHMGFCMLGMMSLNVVGLSGSVLEMVNHGLYTGGLFLLVGMLYERYHMRDLSQFGGLASRLPMWAFMLIWMGLASIALPGLNGFVSEVLCLAGIYRVSPIWAFSGGIGIVLGAWYVLNMIRQVLFGPLREPETRSLGHEIRDLDIYEWTAIAIPAAFCLILGVYPNVLLDLIRPDLQPLDHLYQLLSQGG